jgi:hypothetical protein
MTDGEARQVFVDLVAASRRHFHEAFVSRRIGDAVMGAVIVWAVGHGYSLIGLNSDGENHHLRFEDLVRSTRVLFRVTHLAERLTLTRAQGHLATIAVGLGERDPDVGRRFRTMGSDVAALFAVDTEPGVVSFAADVTSGYLYCQLGLVVDLDTYVAAGLEVDRAILGTHLDGVLHTLGRIRRGKLPPDGTAATPRARAHRRELSESHDEIVLGEVIAAMAETGHSVVEIASDPDVQRVRFLEPGDVRRYGVRVTISRLGATGRAVSLGVELERRTFFSSPDEIIPLRPAELDPSLRRELNALIASDTRRLSVDDLLQELQQAGSGTALSGRATLRGSLAGILSELRARVEAPHPAASAARIG